MLRLEHTTTACRVWLKRWLRIQPCVCICGLSAKQQWKLLLTLKLGLLMADRKTSQPQLGIAVEHLAVGIHRQRPEGRSDHVIEDHFPPVALVSGFLNFAAGYHPSL